jgi:predicted secreted protein
LKDLTKAKPREVEAYLRSKVLEYFGNKAEDSATIIAGKGYFSVELSAPVEFFVRFRRTSIPKVLKALRALR